MKLEIDASNPPKVDVWLGGQEIHDLFMLSINLYPMAPPTVVFVKVEMKDGKPVKAQDGFKLIEEEIAFDEISVVGDWSKMAKALKEDDDPDIPF